MRQSQAPSAPRAAPSAVVAIAALLPLLAGCLAGDPMFDPAAPTAYRFGGTYTWVDPVALDATGTPLAAHALLDALALPTGVQQVAPGSGAEPSAGYTSSGALFVIAMDTLWRTRDHGVTWDAVHEFLSPQAPLVADQWQTADPMFWVDPTTDRLFVLQMFPGTRCLYIATSDDEGESWTDDTQAVAPGFGSCAIPWDDHPKLITAPKGPAGLVSPIGYENIVTVCTNKVVENNPNAILGTWCATSYDGGITFTHEVNAIPPESGCAGINGFPAVHPDGTLVVPAGSIGGVASPCRRTPMVATSADNGVTWTQRRMGGEHIQVGIDPDIAFTPDGTAYMVYTAQDSMTYLTRSPDKFVTWEGPWRLTPPGQTLNVFGAITAGDDGRIAVAFLGTRGEQDDVGRPTDASDAKPGSAWHLFVASSIDAAEAAPTFVVQQVTPEEDPVQLGCVWLRGGTGGPQGCRNLLDFINMERSPDGRFAVAFTDGCVPRNGCTADPQNSNFQSRDTSVSVAIQDRGASLYAANGNLPSLGLKPPPYPAPEASAETGGDA